MKIKSSFKGALALLMLFSLFGVVEGKPPARDKVYVKRVVDGDTLLLRSGERVRLIGVDTPESVHQEKPVEYFSKEASNFTRKMVEKKFVFFEYGPERLDKYNRVLAYVYLENGAFLNAELIKQGYAFAYRRFPHPFLNQFQEYEREARLNAVGLWGRFSTGNDRYDVLWVGSKNKKVYHHPSCYQGAALPEKDLVRFQSKYQPTDRGYKPCRNCVKKEKKSKKK